MGKKVSQVWVCLYSIRSVHPLINHSEPSASSLLFFWLDRICTYKVAAGVHSTQTDGRRKLHLCQVLQNITVPALLWYYHKMSHSHLLCAHMCARARLCITLCKATASPRLFEGQAGMPRSVKTPLQRSRQCLQAPQVPATNPCQTTSQMQCKDLSRQRPGMNMGVGVTFVIIFRHLLYFLVNSALCGCYFQVKPANLRCAHVLLECILCLLWCFILSLFYSNEF